MRRVMTAAAALVFSLILAGCAQAPLELGDRLAVGLISVDYKDDEYTVSAACLDARVSAGESDDILLQYFSAGDETLENAFVRLDDVTSNRLFYGHAAGLALSTAALSQKPHEIMEYFVLDETTRLGLNLYSCEGSAAELIRLKTASRALAVGSIESINKNAANAGYELAPLFKAAAELKGGRSALIPLLGVRRAESTAEGDEEVYELYVARQIAIEQGGGLMYNNFE